MDLICYDVSKNKNIKAGEFNNFVFIKKVSRKKHYFRMIKGYAIEKVVIDRLKELDCKEINIYEKDTKDTLKIDFNVFTKKAMRYLQQMTIKEIYFTKEHKNVRVSKI